MLISRMVINAGAFRRRPEEIIDMVTFAATAGLYSVNKYVTFTTGANYFSSYYPWQLFDASQTSYWIWASSDQTTTLTTSIDTCKWVDIYPGQKVVLNKIRVCGYKGFPTTIAVYGSDTGAFTAGDRVLILSGNLSVAGVSADKTWSQWIAKTGPNVWYKFYRMYTIGPYQFFPQTTGTHIQGMVEVELEVSDNISTAERIITKNNGDTGWTYAASAGSAYRAFDTNVTPWVPNTSAFPANSWLTVDFGAAAKRHFGGWRTMARNSSTYGFGYPGSYSLYWSNTGVFGGEETAICVNRTFNTSGCVMAESEYSPWQDCDSVIGPIRSLKWVFHSWNMLSRQLTSYAGITAMDLQLSNALYS